MDKDPLLIPQVSPSLVSVLQVDIENARCYSITRYRTSRAVTKLDTSGPHRHAILDRCRRTTWLPLTRRTTCELGCYLPPGRPSPALVCPRSFGPPPYPTCGRATNIPFRISASRSDFVYMVPPFIAYFGALQNDGGGLALLRIAYDQIRLYREALFDADVSLWRHVTLGSWEDSGHWATGANVFLSFINRS